MLLAKDQGSKSGMASPFQYHNFWKPKEDSPLGTKKNPNDEFMDMYQFNNHEDHKLTNMFSASNKNHDEDRSIIELPSRFKKTSESFSPVLPKEITMKNPTINRERMLSEELIIDDDDDDVISQKAGSKRMFNKGLKLLSVIVKDIVVEKQATTYKEVADIILKDTIKFENLNLNSKLEVAKEEQNIKRRVYDALNVLIAAGVLIKEGKMVRKNSNNKKIILNLKRLDSNTYVSKIVS